MQYNIVFWVIVAIVVVEFVWDQILTALNRSRMSDHLPPELVGIYEPDEYARQQQYQRANSRLHMVSSSADKLFLLAVLFVGGAGWLDTLIRRTVTPQPVLQAVLFFAAITILTTLISLPFSYYDTFVIEERFGFNKSSRGLFFADTAKSLVLGLVLTSLIVGVVAWLYYLIPGWFWLLAWAVMVFISVGIGYFYSTLIVPLFNKQTPLEEGPLRDRLFKLGEQAGFQIQDIYVMDGSKRSTKANAYFTGFGRRKRIVLYDTLIDDLEPEEIAAVLAHEIGHYKKHHMWLGMALGAAQTGLMMWLMSLFLGNVMMAQALGATLPSFHIGMAAFMLVYAPVSELLAVGESAWSRRHEYQADTFAVRLNLGSQLMSGLKKISAKALSNLTPHPLVVFWEYSHPTLLQRMQNVSLEEANRAESSGGLLSR